MCAYDTYMYVYHVGGGRQPRVELRNGNEPSAIGPPPSAVSLRRGACGHHERTRDVTGSLSAKRTDKTDAIRRQDRSHCASGCTDGDGRTDGRTDGGGRAKPFRTATQESPAGARWTHASTTAAAGGGGRSIFLLLLARGGLRSDVDGRRAPALSPMCGLNGGPSRTVARGGGCRYLRTYLHS